MSIPAFLLGPVIRQHNVTLNSTLVHSFTNLNSGLSLGEFSPLKEEQLHAVQNCVARIVSSILVITENRFLCHFKIQVFGVVFENDKMARLRKIMDFDREKAGESE